MSKRPNAKRRAEESQPPADQSTESPEPNSPSETETTAPGESANHVPTEAPDNNGVAMVDVDEIMRMQSEFETKRKQAIQALLKQQQEIAHRLERLGWKPEPDQEPIKDFRRPPLSQDQSVLAKKGRGGGRKQKLAEERYCKICSIYGHDARAHRGQAVKKKFTKGEMRDLDLNA